MKISPQNKPALAALRKLDLARDMLAGALRTGANDEDVTRAKGNLRQALKEVAPFAARAAAKANSARGRFDSAWENWLNLRHDPDKAKARRARDAFHEASRIYHAERERASKGDV